MNLFIYPFHLQFPFCDWCPYESLEYSVCMDYCVFSNACLTALEMGWA